MKIKMKKVPQDSKIKAGDIVDVTGAEMDTLKASGHEFVTEAEDALITAREIAVDNAIKASKAFAPKEDTSEHRSTAIALETQKPGLGVAYITNLPPLEKGDRKLGDRVTASGAKEDIEINVTEQGLRETVKGFLKAAEGDIKNVKQGGFIRATNAGEKGLADAMVSAREKSGFAVKIANMIMGGAEFSPAIAMDIIKAGDFADAAGALGVLNTGLTLQWNLGHLENQLALLDDIVTDISNTPVLFQQVARTRYIKVPGVQLKTASNAWSGTAGNDVDVNVSMTNYAGVPITVTNTALGATYRQLMNEQKSPQLYGLAEYILYTVINTIMNGSTRIANDGTSTSTIKMASAFVDPTYGAGFFDIAGATAKTFVADLPAAMDLSKMPGGDEDAAAEMLQRFVWAHTNLYSSVAGDKDFLLNETLQGISQNRGENLLRTGRFTRIGNMKVRKSQLVLDNNTTTGSGADGGANALFVVPGAAAAAKVVGFAGTRNALVFCSRVPIDYTKLMPEIPATAAVELVASPKLGITFMIVKFLDHAYETVNMRAQLMWGSAIGDERQGMLLKQQA